MQENNLQLIIFVGPDVTYEVNDSDDALAVVMQATPE